MHLLKKIISVFLLLGFTFYFAHSEMNLFPHHDSENHCHHAHDYCELIKDAKVEKTVSLQKIIIIPQVDLCKLDCFNYIAIESALLGEKLTTNKFSDDPIYLKNQIFLI